MITSSLLALGAFPFLDRLRGSSRPRWMPGLMWALRTALYGYAVAAVFGYWADWSTLAIVIGFVLGERPGWGYPMGQYRMGEFLFRERYPSAEPEWWQLGRLKNNAELSLWVRGAMWGLPVSVFGFVVSGDWQLFWFAVAMTYAFYMAELTHSLFGDAHIWPKSWSGAWNEIYRGVYLGLMLVPVVVV